MTNLEGVRLGDLVWDGRPPHLSSLEIWSANLVCSLFGYRSGFLSIWSQLYFMACRSGAFLALSRCGVGFLSLDCVSIEGR
ncbi:hypothetical protein U1Q18_014597 [Sarracenia purpurea var. burkii]